MRALLAAVVLAALTPAYGMTREYRVPNECAALAYQHNIPLLLTRRDARRAVAKLNQYIFWPGIKECRDAARRDWGM